MKDIIHKELFDNYRYVIIFNGAIVNLSFVYFGTVYPLLIAAVTEFKSDPEFLFIWKRLLRIFICIENRSHNNRITIIRRTIHIHRITNETAENSVKFFIMFLKMCAKNLYLEDNTNTFILIIQQY